MSKTKTTPCPCGEWHEGEDGHHCPDWDGLFDQPIRKWSAAHAKRNRNDLCKQSPEVSNSNLVARILEAVDRLEEADLDRFNAALERKYD